MNVHLVKRVFLYCKILHILLGYINQRQSSYIGLLFKHFLVVLLRSGLYVKEVLIENSKGFGQCLPNIDRHWQVF